MSVAQASMLLRCPCTTAVGMEAQSFCLSISWNYSAAGQTGARTAVHRARCRAHSKGVWAMR